MQQTPSAVEKAKTSLEEVEEYVEDELADGEDDEKRIQRVDFRAGKSLSLSRELKIRRGLVRTSVQQKTSAY